MLKIDRIAVWIFIIFFATFVYSIVLVKFLDEVMVYCFVGLAAADIVINRQWKRYRLLYALLGVMAFYVVYSITAVHYNTPAAVVQGAIIELKPFIPLAVVIAIAPEVTAGEKRILKAIAIFNMILCAVALCSLPTFVRLIYGHVADFGGVCIVSAMVYLYCSISRDGKFSHRHLIVAIVILCIGLACTRSKYYGEFVLSIFFLFIYRPGITRNLTLPRLLMFGVLAAIVIAVSYQKLSFYFLDSIDFNHIDLNKMDSYARMALYAMMFVVIAMHPIFGSGLSSYASYTSAYPYSSLYAELGMDKVYGLSPSKPDFISDAYYPELAQFGIVGIILFIIFWVYIYKYLKVLIRKGDTRAQTLFRVGAIIFCFIFIEMTSGTLVFQGPGEVMMTLLAIICSSGKRLMNKEERPAHDTELTTETKIPKRIR